MDKVWWLKEAFYQCAWLCPGVCDRERERWRWRESVRVHVSVCVCMLGWERGRDIEIERQSVYVCVYVCVFVCMR